MKWYYFKWKGEEIFFQEHKLYGKVIKYQRASSVKNRYNIIGVTEISWISFYGRYLNFIAKMKNVTIVEITKEKFQQEVKEYISQILL